MPTLPVFDTEHEIRAAIALLDPVLREAARDLAVRVVNHRELLDDTDRLRMAFGEQCLFAMARHGCKLSDTSRFRSFLQQHAELVLCLTLSVVQLVTGHARRRRWSWLRGAQPRLEEGLVQRLFGAADGRREAAHGA